jgi:hypothetical protein
MAFQAPPVVDERDGLAAYLLQQHDAFRAAAFGLTDEQAGLAPTASSLSIGGLLKHVATCQEGWLDRAVSAPETPPDRTDAGDWEDEFRWTEADSLERALGRFDDVSGRVLEAVRRVDLDLPVPVPAAPWFPQDVEAWSVRWVWLHLIEELARHAGHADIVREAVDGATMYELVAALDGVPETPWLKPWRPPEG